MLSINYRGSKRFRPGKESVLDKVQQVVPIVLGKHLVKVKNLNVIGASDLSWFNTDGFNYLWNKKKATVNIYTRSVLVESVAHAWVVHELCHVRQILEGRLKAVGNGKYGAHTRIKYRKPKQSRLHVFTLKNGSFYDEKDRPSRPVWEKEALDIGKALDSATGTVHSLFE